MVRLGLPLILVVLNNDGYVIERSTWRIESRRHPRGKGGISLTNHCAQRSTVRSEGTTTSSRGSGNSSSTYSRPKKAKWPIIAFRRPRNSPTSRLAQSLHRRTKSFDWSKSCSETKMHLELCVSKLLWYVLASPLVQRGHKLM
jgi:hypothetical protein